MATIKELDLGERLAELYWRWEKICLPERKPARISIRKEKEAPKRMGNIDRHKGPMTGITVIVIYATGLGKFLEKETDNRRWHRIGRGGPRQRNWYSTDDFLYGRVAALLRMDILEQSIGLQLLPRTVRQIPRLRKLGDIIWKFLHQRPGGHDLDKAFDFLVVEALMAYRHSKRHLIHEDTVKRILKLSPRSLREALKI